MKITCISDTHGKHSELNLPDADVLVHAGDFTEAGTKKETMDFLNWFSNQNHKHKILIAGNHDYFMENNEDQSNFIPSNIYYLNDSGLKIANFNFWGSPVIPGNTNWAFERSRGREIKAHWNKIPKHTDVLITHTPPYKIMDTLDNGMSIGCEELRKHLNVLQPKLHIFGHIHNSYGSVRTKNTLYINSSCLDGKYRNINSPITYSVEDS
ncbi:metallophosphatase domain-containing protein [Salegentibacter sp. F188]|uniref:Metallophosphatase domain-containing protein n=1 Tax=Autumnicola patrickiae TaxID=3075591 RepID=A0ABU3DZV1_9FLAO|nr:metallophosphatase domain-containing protein [Salegentibacter sp. F188]MDT0689273.1 metallophosphatase domain-containing protein [Salegentibacter sp. F188]